MTIQCFWLESTLTARRSLRRYKRDDERCSAQPGYGHQAQAPIDEVPFKIQRGDSDVGYNVFDWCGASDVGLFPHGDLRWPKECLCGAAFTDADAWQVFMDEIYVRTDTGERIVLRDAPAGAMWDAWWYGDATFCSFPIEGTHLMVRCPGTADGKGTADWYVDGRAGNGDRKSRGWQRSGNPKASPPTVTANPSIQITRTNGYHGWLRNGQLVSV
ncbi:MAG TPA: hypothetical protein VHX17_10665 [Candidatus Cybelea sp.]|jgi:hypothetical protein|nr:hypothetical protein [Candidatus Cybelea sp.]